MTSFYTKLIPGIIALFFAQILVAQIPEGGIQMNATTGTTHSNIGVGQLSTITVSDQPFSTALRLVVGTNINNAWDSQIQFRPVEGIEVNDIVLVAFYARTISSVQETGEGKLTAVIENKSTYDKELYQSINLGREWKQYYAPAKIRNTLSSTQVIYSFHTGYRSQTIEIADIRFLNYKQTLTLEELPETEITYSGQDAEAEWRAPAQERINQIRKGVMDINVFDAQGQALENAEVSIEMIRHQFGFGSAIPASQFINNATFRQKVYELFNEVVFENDLKWPQFNPSSTSNLERSLDSLDKYNIDVRGHNIIWPAWRWLPNSLRQYENNPQALRLEIDKRIDQITQFTKGRLNDWDVINEPFSEHEIMDILGPEVMADWFKRVRHNDRDVKLYLNDYAILSGGGLNEVKQDYYYNLVGYIDSLGGGVDGIGLQGHFGSDFTPISKLYSILERFGELGKDIKITEHDINITQREVQAEYTRDFMTIVFSHESVKSLLFWGFWQNSHWTPDAALYNADWSIRPHGQMYLDLVFDQWWTPQTQAITDSLGNVSFEGFLGTYAYTVKDGEQERSGTFTMDHSNKSGIPNTISISLDQTIPVQVSITSSRSGVLCEGDSITLQAPVAEGFNYKWHRGTEIMDNETNSITTGEAGLYTVTVSKGTIETTSPAFEVIVNPYPEAIITVEGELSFCPGNTTTLNASISNDVTYTWTKDDQLFHGSVPSIEVGTSGTYQLITNAKGCATVSEPVDVVVYDATDPQCSTGINEPDNYYRVYPNPFKEGFVLEASQIYRGKLSIEVFNSIGELVYSTQMNPSATKINIPEYSPGLYTLKISGTEGIKIFKMVGI